MPGRLPPCRVACRCSSGGVGCGHAAQCSGQVENGVARMAGGVRNHVACRAGRSGWRRGAGGADGRPIVGGSGREDFPRRRAAVRRAAGCHARWRHAHGGRGGGLRQLSSAQRPGFEIRLDEYPADHRTVLVPPARQKRRGPQHPLRRDHAWRPRAVHRYHARAGDPRRDRCPGAVHELPDAAFRAGRQRDGGPDRLSEAARPAPRARRGRRCAAFRHDHHAGRGPREAPGHARRAGALRRREECVPAGGNAAAAVVAQDDVHGQPAVAAARLDTERPATDLGSTARAAYGGRAGVCRGVGAGGQGLGARERILRACRGAVPVPQRRGAASGS